MLRTERHARILEHVSAKGSVDVNELARLLAVSGATVRRDLQYLSDRKLLQRTHGGAVIGGISIEVPIQRRMERRRPEKQAIARAAAELVPPGAVVGLTGGTTTTEVARLLVGRGPVTIVTNAVNIAAEVVLHKGVTLVVIGGDARSESYELVGPIAEKTLADYHTDITFLGVDGISATHGCTTHDQLEAATDRAFVRSSGGIVVVADQSKIGKVTFAKICPLRDIQHLITDAGAPGDQLAAIADAGVTVTAV
ncbi:DeoR family transcriptional regulator of aga operon [Streptosporangium becharense]|uniref:DeoR family transcriptional regulator of aga operon n=1 Tax=Streptosporangium becharense TaxID=1816182 RepID=A0A7W9IK54_9ACTN|nr:DeoR/GlpR family DNA-binding transcription regulator [Streptosporangium becharense]MBB2911354.1 DeoR family transcriptional regulator of aga operon [Streptosporangium becharense]MBB5821588.1 DeoR family transcriptional regulator of aga operon [Streptosporangium becharense]